MKDISIYFQPVLTKGENADATIGAVIATHTENNFPELVKGGIALLVVPEYRNGELIVSQTRTSAFGMSFINCLLLKIGKCPLRFGGYYSRKHGGRYLFRHQTGDC